MYSPHLRVGLDASLRSTVKKDSPLALVQRAVEFSVNRLLAINTCRRHHRGPWQHLLLACRR